MKVATVVFVLFGIALAQEAEVDTTNQNVTQPCECGWSQRQGGSRQRIVGGTDASPGEFPMMVGLSVDVMPKYVFCGATIITQKHVLTASHCDVGPDYAVSVLLGKFNLKVEESDAVRIPVVEFIKHPEFNKTGASENDVAVLFLAKEIPFSATIGPACFPGPKLKLIGQKVRFIGWGITTYRGKQPDVLQKVDVDVIPIRNCSRVYRSINPGVVCTYTLNKDGCQGDSGGPVIHMDTKTMRYSIIGIVSRGIGCAKPGTPSVNTNVSYFRDWILKQIADTAPEYGTCAR